MAITTSSEFVGVETYFRFRWSAGTLLCACFLSQWTVLRAFAADELVQSTDRRSSDISRKSRTAEKVVYFPTKLQMEQHNEAHQRCLQTMKTDPHPATGFLYCNRTWDNIMCWPDVPAGTIGTQPCPVYLGTADAIASRQCLSDGTWFVHPIHSITWTNYSQCTDNITSTPGHEDNNDYNLWLTKHVGYIKVIYRIGYGLSLVTLSAAVSVMVYFKKLHCNRNTLHINLFLSFIVRAVMAFLRDSLLVSGLGLEKDVHRDEDSNAIVFRDDVTHWECRLLMVVFNYAMANNYMWIFVEGLYLHTLIFTDVFLETSSVVWYIVFGWTSSLVIVIPWAIVRATLENVICWNTHPTAAYFWIIKTPIVITVLLNFFFFINTVRVLTTKLRASTSSGLQRYMQRKLARSTLVLIPLFGVPYVVFLGMPDNPSIIDTAEVVKLYFEMTFNSFNGVLVAMLFCFLNGEVGFRMHLRDIGQNLQSYLRKVWQWTVQSEVRKKWRRYNALNSVMRNGSKQQQHQQQTMTTSAGVLRRCSRSVTGSTAVYFPRFARHSAYSIQSLSTRLDSVINCDQVTKHLQQDPDVNGASPKKKKKKRRGRMSWIYRRRMDTMTMDTIKDSATEADGIVDQVTSASPQQLVPRSKNDNSLSSSDDNSNLTQQPVPVCSSICDPSTQNDYTINAG